MHDYLDALEGDVWEEKPLSFKDFCSDIIGNNRVAPLQCDIGERMSQILRKDTLEDLYGPEEAERLWKKTAKDNCLIIGKGGSKNFITQLAFLYIIYILLCMKDPQGYYGRDPDDNIDLVNMATSARQASNGFFNKMVSIVKRVSWFAGKFHPRQQDISFDKHVTLHSLHSQPEAAEGLNILAVVLDEVDSPEIDGSNMYDYLSGTVTSRFPDLGKVVMLSFPRSKEGFIMNFYNNAVGDNKVVEKKSHTYKLDVNLPDGLEENEFTVEWTEEHVIAPKYDNVYCAKYPAYVVNPIAQLEGYKMAFLRDIDDALMRFFAVPADAADNAFFKNHDKLARIFAHENGYQESDSSVVCHPQPDTNYYIHVDLSQVADRTVVALGHVDKWVTFDTGSLEDEEPQPHIIVDLFRVWEPSRADPVNHNEVMQFVRDLCKKFNVQRVTFDQWHSFEHVRKLTELGIQAEKKSLARAEYMEFAAAVADERLEGPNDERLLDELKHLVILPTGKIDHPNRHHNDISEAVCGVIRNCVEFESPDSELQLVTLDSLMKSQRERKLQTETHEAIVDMPEDIKAFLRAMKAI